MRIFPSGLLIFILINTLLFPPSRIFAKNDPPSYIVFINQIRGEECCDVGSAENYESQLKALDIQNLKGGFVLRYDALNNTKFISLSNGAKINHQLGGLLEITPSLASDAQVTYQGNNNDWFKSKYAFLIGYSQPDRKKIIDTYMDKYKSIFGEYPKLTASWMIDSYSLEYLSTYYQVQVHQITREQWGMDSYTLYGGSPHYPYYPSINYPLIPSLLNSLSTLIVRQTVQDPLYGYGDKTSSFTSQPNDYILDGKDISYFTLLLEQALAPSANAYQIAILGLENNMGQSTQQEYIKQIAVAKNYLETHQNSRNPNLTELPSLISKSDLPTIVHGLDLIEHNSNQVWWLMAGNYRLRIRLSDSRLLIDEIRIHNDSLTDPYKNTELGNLNGYWITPFLLDQSKLNNQTEASIGKSLFARLIPSRKKSTIINPISLKYQPTTDISISYPYISLPAPDSDTKFTVSNQSNKIDFVYSSAEKPVTISFNNSNFRLPLNTNLVMPTMSIPISEINHIINISNYPPIIIDQQGIFLQSNKINILGLTMIRQDNELLFETFNNLSININNELDSMSYVFNPENYSGQVSSTKSIIYAHNRRAVIGQNPIRIVVQGFDSNNLPTNVKTLQVTDQIDEQATITLHRPSYAHGDNWIDIQSLKPGEHKIFIDLGDSNITTLSVEFIPNCRENFEECLRNPSYLAKFIFDKIRTRITPK